MARYFGFDDGIAVIGDVVDSRRHPHRITLHDELTRAFGHTSSGNPPLQAWWITAGDEFQSAWPSLPSALLATLRLRLSLLPEVDLRFGLGRGGSEVFDEGHGIQDGPAWWAARRAIIEAKQMSHRPRTHSVRTRIDGDPVANALVALQDERIAHLDTTGLTIVRGLADGRTQQDIAEELGTKQPAVAGRLGRRGLGSLVQSIHELQEHGASGQDPVRPVTARD